MATRTVTGTIYHPGGVSPWANANVVFRLAYYFSIAGYTFPEETYTAVTNAAGAFTVDVAVPTTGTASYEVKLPDGTNFYVNLAAGAPTTLEALIAIIANPTAPQNTLQTLIDAHAGIPASTTVSAHVELATVPEAQAGVDTTRPVTPAGLPAFALNVPANGLAVGSSQLVVSGGNVGINKLIPDSQLHVVGGLYEAGIDGDRTVLFESGEDKNMFVRLKAGLTVEERAYFLWEDHLSAPKWLMGRDPFNGFVNFDNSGGGTHRFYLVPSGLSDICSAGAGAVVINGHIGDADCGTGGLIIKSGGVAPVTWHSFTANTINMTATAGDIYWNCLSAGADSSLNIKTKGAGAILINYNNAATGSISYYGGAAAAVFVVTNAGLITGTQVKAAKVGAALIVTDRLATTDIFLQNGYSILDAGVDKWFIGMPLEDIGWGQNNTMLSFGTTGALTASKMLIRASGSVMIGTTTDGMTAAGSLAIAKDLAHRGTLAGFYNHAPAAQPTKAGHNNWAALSDVVAALVAIGIFDTA